MFWLKKIGCRIFQLGFRAALPILPYREPTIVSHCGALSAVFAKEKSKSVLIVTDRGIVKNGLVAPVEAVLLKVGIPYAVYDETSANPTVENVEAALRMYRRNHCNTLIAIGGGSAMDCAKAVGARVVYPKKSLAKMAGILRPLKM